MKSSKYNFFYPYGVKSEKYIAYNSFSNALALLSNEKYHDFKKFEANQEYELDETFFSKLIKGNFIIDDNVNELELIREKMLRCRYNTSSLGLTIAPTLNCNFRCVYCYEKGCEKNGNMSEEVQRKIIEYVEVNAPTINSLVISWHGGEPLLAIDIIEHLTKEFLRITKKYNIEYSASIVTNGYLLNSEILDRLVICQIKHCQITIDGNRETHNERRPHVKGINTYDTIIQNACVASKFFPVGVRVNIDKENRDAIFDVRKAINNEKYPNIAVHPAPIRVNNNCYMDDVCMKSTEFLEFEYQYIISIKDKNALLRKYPTSYGNSCCADSLTSLVISTDGDLYKCWSDIGRKSVSLGNILEGKFNITRSIQYSKYDPTRDKKCNKCKFLPICMGGCPRDVLDRPNDRCIHVKKLNKLYITAIASALEQRDSKEKNLNL